MPTLSETQKAIYKLHDKKRDLRGKFRDLQKTLDEDIEHKKNRTKLLEEQTKIQTQIKELTTQVITFENSIHTRLLELQSNISKPSLEELNSYRTLLSGTQKKHSTQYEENRDRLFKIIADTLKDKDELTRLLTPKTGDAEGEVSTWEAVKFAASHPLTVARTAFIKSTLEDEVDKFTQILTGESKETINDPSFLLRLLNDKELLSFLKLNTTIISTSLDDIVPLVTPPLMLVLSKMEPFNTIIEEMKKIGIDAKYINAALLPVARGPIKDLITNYQDFLGIINLSLNAAQTTDPVQKQKLLQEVWNSLPINRIIETSHLGDFVQREKAMVTSAVMAATKSNTDLATMIQKYSIAPDLVRNAVDIFTQLSTPLLQNTELLNKAMTALGVVAFGTQAKSDSTLEEQIHMEQLSAKQRLAAISDLSDIMTNPQILTTLTQTLPQLMTQHKDAITTSLTKAISLEASKPIDKEKPTPLQLLKGAPQETLQTLIPTIITTTTALLSSVSPAQIESLLSSTKTILSIPETDVKTRTAAIDKLTTELMPLLSSQAVQSVISQDIPALLQNPNLVTALPTILSNLKEYSPEIKLAIEQYDISDAIFLDVAKLTTTLITPILQNSALLNKTIGAIGTLLRDDSKATTPEEQQLSAKQRLAAISDLSDIMTNPQILTTLTQALPQLLTQHKDAIATSLTKAINLEASKPIDKEKPNPLQLLKGTPQETLQTLIPTIITTTTALLSSVSPAQIQNLLGTAKTILSTPETDVKTRTAAIDKLRTELMPLLSSQAVQSVISQDIPALLQNPNLVTALPTILSNLKEYSPEIKLAIEQYDISDAIFLDAAKLTTKSLATLLPLNTNILEARQHFVKFMEEKEGEDKNTALSELLKSTKPLFQAFRDILSHKETTLFITSHDKDIQKMLSKVGINIPTDEMKTTLPLITTILSSIPQQTEVISSLYKYATEYDRMEYSDKTKAALLPVLKEARALCSANKELLSTTLPEYLASHQETLKQITKFVTKSEYAKQKFDDLKITSSLIEQVADVASQFTITALPIITKILDKSLTDDPEGLANIIHLITQPDEKNKSPKIHALECVSAVYSFGKKNPEIASSIKNDIPKLFKEHAKELGGVVDEFLNRTEIGKKYNIKGQELLTTASKHLPQLLEITDLYAKHEYAKMIPKAVSLLFNKDVFILCVKLAFTKKTIAAEVSEMTNSLDKIKKDVEPHMVTTTGKEKQMGQYSSSKIQELSSSLQKTK